jgi:hypothetical protein
MVSWLEDLEDWRRLMNECPLAKIREQRQAKVRGQHVYVQSQDLEAGGT